MQLKTKHFGEIEIDEKGIISFPDGLPGFNDARKFVLLGKIDEENPFQWLQSVDKPELAFVVASPFAFKPDYDVDINDEEIEVLNIKDITKILVYGIVVLPENITEMTMNLKAPIVINAENNMGKQVTIERGDYPIRYYIMKELQKMGGHE